MAIYWVFFLYCETENFPQKNAISPPLHKVYRNRTFFETEKDSSTNFPVLTGKVVPTEKRDITLVGVNIFDTGNLLKHRKVYLRKFFVLRDYNFRRKIVKASPHIH